MSNPVYELKALLLGASKAPVTGKVVSVGKSGVVVSTDKGTVVATNMPGVGVSPGSKVNMQGSIITGVSTNTDALPIYYV